MIPLLFIPVILIALVVIISLAWRFASRRYTLPCPVWMKWLLDPPSSGGVSARTRKTIGLLEVKPGMSVLDAGCGPGRLTIPLAQCVGSGGEVTAMDLQEGMLQEVQDRAVLITVLGEIPDRDAALPELFAALRPGGILLVEETIRDPHFQTRSTVTRLAGAAGFTQKEFSGNRFSYSMTLEKPAGIRD